MNTVICRETAEIEVKGWEEQFGADLLPALREPVVRAFMAGRLTLDTAKQEFTYRLWHPIALENGEKVAELRIREPNAGQIRDAEKGTKGETDQSLRLLSFITGLALGLIERLGQKDLTVAGVLFSFFG